MIVIEKKGCVLMKMVNHTVENKYHLTPYSIQQLGVHREKVGEPLFWRNEQIKAWCVSGSTAKNEMDEDFGTYNDFWLGIYDDENIGIRLNFLSYGGMCKYTFEQFFNADSITCPIDLEVQEMCLAKVNELIDNGILYKRD